MTLLECEKMQLVFIYKVPSTANRRKVFLSISTERRGSFAIAFVIYLILFCVYIMLLYLC